VALVCANSDVGGSECQLVTWIPDEFDFGVQSYCKVADRILVSLSSLEHFSEDVFVFLSVKFSDASLFEDELQVGYQTSLQCCRRVARASSSPRGLSRRDFALSCRELCW